MDLTARVGAVVLPNPVMTASGTAGHGAELGAYFDLSRLGAVVVKSLSSGPWAGNPGPRIHQSGAGMLNSVGLQNPGIEEWLARDLPALAATGARVVASIWGFRAGDYRDVAAAVAGAAIDVRSGGAPAAVAGVAPAAVAGVAPAPAGVAPAPVAGVAPAPAAIVAVEANISCPNIEDRRRVFAHSCEGAATAVAAAAAGLGGTLPLWVKLSPNVTDLPAVAAAAVAAGADAIVLTNTLMGLALDPATGRPVLGGGGGGLSGPALHPVAVRAVYDCRSALPDVAIIGVGGVGSGREAAELLAAGADAVQVGTATFADPRAPLRVLDELEAWCRSNGVSSVRDLSGRAQRWSPPVPGWSSPVPPP